MKHRYSTITVCALLAGQATGAGMPTLEELESRIDGSKAMQMLDARYEIARNRIQHDAAPLGASLYSHTSFSDNDEVVDVGRSRSYRQLSSGVGVRVPLLGSRLKWQESLLGHEQALSQLESERELQRRMLLRDLRRAYSAYWAAQRYASLSRSYLEHEHSIDRSLALRTQAGLLLDADRLEFMSGFSLVRRDHVLAEAERHRALQSLRTLVNGDIAEGLALRPAAASVCAADESAITAWASNHPEVRFLRQVEAHAIATPRDSPFYGVNSEIRVGYHTSTEWPVEQDGGSAAIVWSFDVPLNFLNQRKLTRASAAAARSHARLEHELRQEQIVHELRALLAQRGVLDQSLHFATVRLAAGDEAVRERELRAASLAGDVIEQLQQARLARYTAAKAVVDAEVALENWAADWSMYAPPTCRPRALYVWSSQHTIEALASAERSGGKFAAAAERSDILLLSLDAEQIGRYTRDPKPLRDALASAQRRGLRVELLLGEPTWLLPAHRDGLLSIVRDLRSMPFDGLHLDIEPDQLPDTSEEVWRHWLETIRAAGAISPWHVDVSLHPRYLNERIDGRTLGEHLTQAGVSVTLMIYVSNPARVVEIAEPLLARYPRLSQRIALSTEDTLPREESLYYLDPDERSRRIALVESLLTAPNFRGITIQPTPARPRNDIVMSR